MTASLGLTDSQILTALRAFLLAVLPSGIEVIKGQTNRVAEPEADNFVVMTPTMRTRLETNVVTYFDPFDPSTHPIATDGSRYDLAPTQVTVQIDVHGPAGADNSQIITTLFRSEFAVTQFFTSGFDVTPLYAGDPRQMPFLNGEEQYEDRWSIDAVMQVNSIVTTAQQFAGTLSVGLVDVDEAYPPA